MYNTLTEFTEEWSREAAVTDRVLAALTDESLEQSVTMLDRTMGEIAWHITTSMHDILSHVELEFSGKRKTDPPPSSAMEIAESYRQSSKAIIEAMESQWTDATLHQVHDIYGMAWPNTETLNMLIKHQIHHRGQLTVLMRQAGLPIPDIYGPSRKE